MTELYNFSEEEEINLIHRLRQSASVPLNYRFWRASFWPDYFGEFQQFSWLKCKHLAEILPRLAGFVLGLIVHQPVMLSTCYDVREGSQFDSAAHSTLWLFIFEGFDSSILSLKWNDIYLLAVTNHLKLQVGRLQTSRPKWSWIIM